MIDAHSVVDDRILLMEKWLSDIFPEKSCSIAPLAGDASFRRYFRATVDCQTYVVMDAPPEKENCDAFIAVARAFENATVQFPKIFASDLRSGFLLLTDFGDRQLLPLLNSHSADTLYRTAMDDLLRIQQRQEIAHYNLPHFDDTLYWREFEILDTWYIKKNLGKNLSHDDEKKLKNIYQSVLDSFLEQPKVFVHRDYHSRNIMVCNDNRLGILDFQDAVWGTITYDLVSLLKDCYIAWQADQVEKWALYFYEKLIAGNKISAVDFSTFMRWFDFAGLQRHLKCLGIFSRLHFRDHKQGYLKEIPRVLNYVVTVCNRYPELLPLKNILSG
ncbi:MAG TPA: phosphotransferase [Coxiellaceae bacterium]|nr:MAG: hypothetical protein A3E81_08555 [Gammaproteobacteria bacterium RIFCSPHIGHO2_12_FULL_36_30]HLB55732.1 phosphotransferase [Coxiellaceae bacterium]